MRFVTRILKKAEEKKAKVFNLDSGILKPDTPFSISSNQQKQEKLLNKGVGSSNTEKAIPTINLSTGEKITGK